MKYPIYNRWARWSIACVDFFLTPLKTKKVPKIDPQRILLCNTAHLGDVLLTLTLLPSLKKAYPHAQIGVLVGSWSKPLVENHPHISHVHLIDHWKVNRRSQNFLRKLFRYFHMRKQALKQLKEINYDLAIDCGLHFPNMAPLLWSAKIPLRYGFSSAGFGPFLTHTQPWNPAANIPVIDSYFSLLKLPKIMPAPLKTARKPYIVVHMGSGNVQKNWPETHWKQLVERLVNDGETLLFTGLGPEENSAIEKIHAHFPQTTNLCDKLSWSAFADTIHHASLLIASDTAAAHLAAISHTPAVLLYTGIQPSQLWIPNNPSQVILRHPTPCSPCFTGCPSMSCIRSIPVTTVHTAIRSKVPRMTQRV